MIRSVVGNKHEFAIEAELTGADGPWRLGRLRLWIRGRPLGEFDETVDLAACARWARRFLSASPQRTRSDLDAEPAVEVYRLLYGRYFERGEAPVDEPFIRDPFVLDEVGDAALRDRLSILVLRRGDESDRLLVREHAGGSAVEEYVLPPARCDQVLLDFCHWAEGL